MKNVLLVFICLLMVLLTVPVVVSRAYCTFSGGILENENLQEINLGELTPKQARDTLIWNVNRNIAGFRLEVKAGRPIILEIKIPGRTEKWTLNKFYNAGQMIEQILNSVINVGKIQVEVSQSLTSKLRLVVYVPKQGTDEEGTTEQANEIDLGTLQATQYTQSLVWNVNRKITGLKVVSTKGHPSVMQISFPGRSEKWDMHKEINVGQFVEKKLTQPVQVSKVQINLYKAENTGLKLIVYSVGSGSDETLLPGEVDMGILAVTGDTPLVWNVNRNITSLKVVSMKGHPSVLRISFPGRSEKWDINKEINVGQFVEKKLAQTTQVGKIQVNVYQAAGTKLKLIIHEAETGEEENESGEADMGTQTASNQSEKDRLIWNVNRNITGFRLQVKQGNLRIDQVKFVGRTEKWNVGQNFATGQTFEKQLPNPVQVDDISVDVDSARSNQLNLVVFTAEEEPQWDEVEFETHSFWDDTDQAIWNVDHIILGFRIEVIKGTLTMDEVAFYRGLKWQINKSFLRGQKYEQILDEPAEVSKLRVKVRYAREDSVKLVVYIPREESTDTGEDEGGEVAGGTGGEAGDVGGEVTGEEATGGEVTGDETAGKSDEGALTPEEELQKALEELLKSIKY
jgi:hypothetical protein